MGIKDSIQEEIKTILDYDIKIKRIDDHVPTKSDLNLGETAAVIQTAVLFTDIRNSSSYTDTHWKTTTAKTINAFLNCSLRIIKKNNGEVRSFNGDSLLAFFEPNSSSCEGAVRSAMELTWAVHNIIVPLIKAKRYTNKFDIGIGVSYGEILTTKVGIRGEDNNDLIWTSKPTNLAAKMGNHARQPYNIIIDHKVLELLPDKLKYDETKSFLSWLLGTFRQNYWEKTDMSYANRRECVYQTKKVLPI